MLRLKWSYTRTSTSPYNFMACCLIKQRNFMDVVNVVAIFRCFRVLPCHREYEAWQWSYKTCSKQGRLILTNNVYYQTVKVYAHICIMSVCFTDKDCSVPFCCMQHWRAVFLPGSRHFPQSAVPPSTLAATFANMELHVGAYLQA
jgi:hypothetical protein